MGSEMCIRDSKWVMLDAACIHSRLVLPMEQPQADEAWSRAKLDDRRAKSVLEKMNADLRPGNMKAEKLTGATLLREFLVQRVAPLQAHSHPLWTLGGADDDLRLNSAALANGDLVAALRFLVGEDVEGLEGTPAPCSFPTTGNRWWTPCPPLMGTV